MKLKVGNSVIKVITVIKFICLISLIALYPSVSSAQNFTASVSKNTVAVGERLQVTFSIDASGSQFQPPAFTDFNVLMGPSQSTNMQFINGTMSQSISYTYILEP